MAERTRTSTRHRLVVIGTFAAFAVAVFGLAGWLTTSRSDRPVTQSQAAIVDAPPTDYGSAPSYALTDQNGRPFSSTQLRGKVRVVSYLFPYCTSECPVITRTLEQVEQRLGRTGLAGKVEFVAFNVDPTGAGPTQMAAFLEEYGIDPTDRHWHFLTGPASEIRRVVQGGFHVFYQQVSLAEEEQEEARQQAAGTYSPEPTLPNSVADKAHVDYDIVHNDTIAIVGPDGVIRQLFVSGAQASVDALVGAIEKVSPAS